MGAGRKEQAAVAALVVVVVLFAERRKDVRVRKAIRSVILPLLSDLVHSRQVHFKQALAIGLLQQTDSTQTGTRAQTNTTK
jgi:hypothetical protein